MAEGSSTTEQITPAIRKAVKDFTKSTPEGILARQQVATQAWRERKEKFSLRDRISLVDEELNAIRGQKVEPQSRMTNIVGEVRAIQTELAAATKSIRDRLLTIIGPKFRGQSSANAELQTQLQLLDDEFKTLVEQEAAARHPKETIDQFYKDQYGKITEIEDIESGDIKRVAQHQDVYFVHAISYETGDHRVFFEHLSDNPSWKDKLAILLMYQPTVAGSSYQKRAQHLDRLDEVKTGEGLFASQGVIFSGGHIDSASLEVVDSQAQGIHGRISQAASQVPLDEQIKAALVPRSSKHENELFISYPEIAGLWVDLEHANVNLHPNIKEIGEVSQELQVPIFGLSDGKAYEVTYDPKTETLIGSHIYVSPQEMVTRSYKVPDRLAPKLKVQADTHLSPLVLI